MKNKNKNNDEVIGNRMLELAKKLYPLNRSIMGPDIRKSFNFFLNIHREFKPIFFKTGDTVFDWEIPKEWVVRDAYLKHEDGKKFAEFKKNNLHLVGYSEPINRIISKKELIKKIYSLPSIPDAIPYVTSYYKKDWGFCLTEQQKISLPEGNYKVFIDSEHNDGKLMLIEAIIPGKSKKEIFFSSYLCHPSMANNELSGPVVLNELVNHVKNIKNRYYTYRFVLIPETIGSIAYLSKKLDELKRNIICGFNLSCVGDERAYSHITSRNSNNIADRALHSALLNLDNVFQYDFLERGSDERQYCAPGVDLPLCTFCRSKFGTFPEYHTSKDDFNLVSKKGLLGSFEIMKTIIEAFEFGLYPNVKVLCEPQLGKRDLYPQISKLYEGKHPAKLRTDLIAFCDSKTNIFEIAIRIKVNLKKVLEELIILKGQDLLELTQQLCPSKD